MLKKLLRFSILVFAVNYGAQLLHTATLFLFPTAETVLKKEGLDQKLAQELAPHKKIHVRKDDFWGKLHATFDQGILLASLYKEAHLTDGHGTANARPKISKIFKDACAIYITKEARRQESTYIDPNAFYQYALLHEIAHCGDDNQKHTNPVLREADADYTAMTALSKPFDQNMKTRLFYNHVLQEHPRSHDTVLYLDAWFNGTATPAAKDVDQALLETATAWRALHDGRAAIYWQTCHEKPEVCDYNPDTSGFSPLGQRRIALFKEAFGNEKLPRR